MTGGRYYRLFQATVIPHAAQRYATTGDWMRAQLGSPMDVRVSDMGDDRYHFLIAIHETIEAQLCEHAGIAEEVVSAFDVAYEQARDTQQAAPCGCVPTNESEPGDDVHAPYYDQHQTATSIERLLALKLGVDWDAYEQANLNLYEQETPLP